MAPDSKVYHFDEVSKHKTKKDCWLIIAGKVYDVTPFMDDHPGSDEVLLAATGKDATNEFEDVGHTDSAVKMLDKFYIGEVDTSSVPTPKEPVYVPLEQPAYSPDKSSQFIFNYLVLLVPTMILGLAFAVKHFTKVVE